MAYYPFYEIEGKEVHEVAVGPIHAGVIEPGSFRFMCLGEQVHHLEIHLGYQHRGVETLLLERRPAHARAARRDHRRRHERRARVGVRRGGRGARRRRSRRSRSRRARGVMLELERIAMHLAGLAGLAADVGFLQGASTYGRLRTTAINTSMRLCGSRFGRGAVRPAGSACGSSALARRARRLALAELRATSRSSRRTSRSSTTASSPRGRSGIGCRASASSPTEHRRDSSGSSGMAARASRRRARSARARPAASTRAHPIDAVRRDERRLLGARAPPHRARSTARSRGSAR